MTVPATPPLLDHSGQEAWADAVLEERGCRRTGPYDRVHVRPWATVATTTTDAGRVWLKAHTPVLTHEAAVTRVLARLRPDVVLDVLASDDDRCWLVTADAGVRLRGLAPTADDLHLLVPVLASYADLQRRAAAVVPDLVVAGAFDRRADRVVGLLLETLDTPATGAEVGHALAAEETAALRVLAPRLGELATAAAAVVPDSIDHADLHDGNVFVLDGVARVADFGDSAVGHPLASFVLLERSLGHRLGLDRDGPELRRLRDAYLEPWTDVAPLRELTALAASVRPLALLGRGVTWRALVASIDDPAMAEFGDGWPSYARELVVALTPVAGPR